MNIAQHLERAKRHLPDRTAIVAGERSWTYAELDAAASQAAHALQSLGVQAGDRVALFLPNIPEFVLSYLSVQKLGAIAVSVNSMLTTEELGYVLEDSGANVLVLATEAWSRAAELVGQAGMPRQALVCGGTVPGQPSFDELLAGRPREFAARQMDRDSPAAILYTSGTTGRQKGAVLSQGNLVSNTYAVAHHLRLTPEDRLQIFLPLFHCFGQNFLMNGAFAAGASFVLHERYDPAACVEAVREHGVTIFSAVPTIYIGLLNAGVDPALLSSVRLFFSAAATMPAEVAQRWNATYGRVINEGYGLTETSPFASWNHDFEYRPESVGTPIEMVEMCVMDEDDRPVEPGVWGEICIKGPNVMLGYWQRPEDSAAALRGGWFHSGDIGYVDAEGYFYLVDRVKDMINSAGFKIWPREVEEVLYRHEAIKECAVVGLPDAVKGEVAAAYIVLQAGRTATGDALEGYCREHLAAYKVPRSFEFVDSLPKSSTGKVLKRVLRGNPA